MADDELQGLRLEDLLIALEGADRSGATPLIGEIVRRFEPLLRRGWKRMALDLDYEDFAQEVFLRLFSSLNRLKERKAFPGYFRRIVTSVALDLARQRRLARFEDELDPAEIASDIDRNLLGALYVRSYLEHLPEREAKVLALTFLDGLKTAEIAHLLRLAHSSVRATKFRGIRRLRSILNSEALELEKLAKRG
jgi:RNA polymerase sigma-70 factor (ECF subfamily)